MSSHRERTIRIVGRRAALPVVAGLALLATGCPSFRLVAIDLAPGSIDDAGFTLAATVEVTEEDPPVDDDGNLDGGRGVLGVWLPPDWQATAARAAGPDDDALVELTPIDDAAGHFPPTFPYVPGTWFAFVTDCDHVPEGVREHQVEVDVEGPAGATAVTLGLAAARFDDAGSNGPVPTEVTVDLGAATVAVREAPAPPASAGLAACESIRYEDAADDDSCGCATAGARTAGATLLGLLLALI